MNHQEFCSNPPIKQYNEYACTIASFVYNVSRLGKSFTQLSFVDKFKNEFPKWASQPGIAAPADILHMLKLVDLHPVDFIATKDLTEATTYIKERSPYVGFCWTRRKITGNATTAQDHCMAFICCKSDLIKVMDPADACIKEIGKDVFKIMDGTVLLCTEHSQNTNFR
jgi:hypothetical protein